jgi:hypothetical protein
MTHYLRSVEVKRNQAGIFPYHLETLAVSGDQLSRKSQAKKSSSSKLVFRMRKDKPIEDGDYRYRYVEEIDASFCGRYSKPEEKDQVKHISISLRSVQFS